MNSVKRVIVEKRDKFGDQSEKLLLELRESLHISELNKIRILNVYDIEGLMEEDYEIVKKSVLSEPNVDNVYDENFEVNDKDRVFRVQFLPGQFDQRADSARQCIEIVTLKSGAIIDSSKIYVLSGTLSDNNINSIKNYLINSVEAIEVPVGKPISLEKNWQEPMTVNTVDGFINMGRNQLFTLRRDSGFAMSDEDIVHIQKYFLEEDRDPTITELKVLDTYWSDHCRHTTFNTKINNIEFEDGIYSKYFKETFEDYINARKYVYGDRDKDISLMDMAVISAKKELKAGNLDDLDISDEINACSINVKVDINGENEDYLVMFKNETHNHPTEIEPFGGASTCLGGAIRDPLSGRVYVYQGMRVTGSADPRTPYEETISGKLPQKKITVEAAKGFSSYGNQIGLATGLVHECYHDGFVAKRMEVGAVIGAAPKKNVRREEPINGDIVIIVGGETGRDGCGGATGSSKEHDEESLSACGAEVQKGNAPVERKLQRLFRNPNLSGLIKRCNDFGAGGVSVAIGELADSIDINLDKVPVKYAGLDGTELAISESQERMAVVIDKNDLDKFLRLAYEENLNAIKVADITDSGYLRMIWKGKVILNLNREFIETNGVKSEIDVKVMNPDKKDSFFNKNINKVAENVEKEWLENLGKLNICSQQGLVENFDSSVGAGTVLMPFGGQYFKTPTQGMVAKIPVENGNTTTGTIMTFGYDPEIGNWSPYHGGMYSVIDSIAKLVAIGGDYKKARFSMQEYFEKLGDSTEKWGKPFSGLLGAFKTLNEFNLAAIGGKDSMSGTFKDINVPPTVISFAVATTDVRGVISPELKLKDSVVMMFNSTRNDEDIPDFKLLKTAYEKINIAIKDKKIIAAYAIGKGGIVGALSKMAFGNRIGVIIDNNLSFEDLLEESYGSIIFEVPKKYRNEMENEGFICIANTTTNESITYKDTEISLEKALNSWENTLNLIFPIKKNSEGIIENIEFVSKNRKSSKIKIARPKVFIPAFPGTNCEYDTKKAFEEAGAEVEIVVFNNLNSQGIMESIDRMVKAIENSQIIAIPGGFSAGDEPDGSGKFIASVFRNPKMTEAVMEFIKNRDGLMLGICNGFQALIKLGLLPYGEIMDLTEDSPTLTINKIGRHISKVSRTKISSNLSPWLSLADMDGIYNTPLSHGEGRFICNDENFKILKENGQIATQYVDFNNIPSNDGEFNPNGSFNSIEGITSADGRIFGKMGHNERCGNNVMKNIPGRFDIRIFEAGVKYFK